MSQSVEVEFLSLVWARQAFQMVVDVEGELIHLEHLLQSYEGFENPPPWVFVLRRYFEALEDRCRSLQGFLNGPLKGDPIGGYINDRII